MNRRTSLKSLGLLAGLSLMPGWPLAARRVLRFAHLTDIHLEDKNRAPQRLAACLHELQSLSDPPAFILNGGDTIMDALARNRTQVEAQWRSWDNVIRQECSLPIEHCIGNHDVWGAGEKGDPLYGKYYALEKMQLERPYRSFTRAGWQFVILDSTHPPGEGWYTAKLDEAQFAWLESELAHLPADRPVLVVSHIPILSASVFYRENLRDGQWEIPGSWMHTDYNRLMELFLKHSNVRLCLSGHMHLLDEVTYNGITFMCNGAVSGNWWLSPEYHQTRAGYALIDLYEDGNFRRSYHSYAWEE